MAASTVTEEDLRVLLDGAPPGRPLVMLYMLDDPEQPTSRVVAFILRYRPGGFMAMLPLTDVVTGILASFETDGSAAPPYFTETGVQCETPRRRMVGEVPVYLVDVP